MIVYGSKMGIRLWQRFTRTFTLLAIFATLNVATPQEYLLPKSNSKLHLFNNAAVSSDAKVCSEIGTKILQDGGNVADAAIATSFCNGIATMQSQGIGGGFIMNLFIGGKAYSLNSRDVAPINLKNETFKSAWDYGYGTLSIGTPGEVKGCWELHKRFGSMKWEDLIQPAIDLCERGIEITHHMRFGLEVRGNITDPYLRKTFVNDTPNKKYDVGTHVYPAQQLCDTYKSIAENGGEDFYTGHLADLLVEDLKDVGSVITKQDLQEYRTVWSDSIPIELDNHTMHITPAPTGGAIIALILNILKGYQFTPDSIATDEKKILTYHRIIESFKFGFAQRSRIGDPDYVDVAELHRNLTSTDYAETIRRKIDDAKTINDALHYGAEYDISADHGTSHTSILGPNGDAAAITSSINNYFGCARAGKRTGVLFNTGISDFGVPPFKNGYGVPPSPANYLAPKKRALSSMSPIIITDKNNNVEMVIGAAGGVRIITGVSLAIMRSLWFQQNIKEAIDGPRVHHQVVPMVVEYEYGISQTLISGLEARGHVTKSTREGGADLNAIYKNETGIYANADFRKKGDATGF